MLVIQNHPKEKLLLSCWDNTTGTTDGRSSRSLSLLGTHEFAESCVKTSWATASQPNFASRTAELPSTSLSQTYGFCRYVSADTTFMTSGSNKKEPDSPDHLITFPNHMDFILYLYDRQNEAMTGNHQKDKKKKKTSKKNSPKNQKQKKTKKKKNSRFSWVAPLKTPEMLKCQLIIDSDQGAWNMTQTCRIIILRSLGDLSLS